MLFCANTLLHTFFFFNDTATTEIYTLSLHDALPILITANGNTLTTTTNEEEWKREMSNSNWIQAGSIYLLKREIPTLFSLSDRKSTRLNSSHANISYAVFCLKKKKRTIYCLQKNQQ